MTISIEGSEGLEDAEIIDDDEDEDAIKFNKAKYEMKKLDDTKVPVTASSSQPQSKKKPEVA